MTDTDRLASIRARADAATEPVLEAAMMGDTDGGLIDPESDIPIGEAFRLALPVVAAARADIPFLLDQLAAAERERDEARALVTPALEEGMEAVRQKQAAEAKFVELAKLHHAKTGENNRGPYLICDYDKTEWPCRTWELLFGEQT